MAAESTNRQKGEQAAHSGKLTPAQAQARLFAAEARRRMAEKKASAQRNFVAGAAILAAVQDGLVSEDQVREWVDRWATRSWDRKAFGLDPLPKTGA